MRIDDLLLSRFYYVGPNEGDRGSSRGTETDQVDGLSLTAARHHSDWSVRHTEYWSHWVPNSYVMPQSGWKIHLSVELDGYDEAIGAVVPLLIDHRVAFKYAKSRAMYRRMLDKNADRRQAGKCITIYPLENNCASLIRLIGDAHSFRAGPVVLTDLPTKYDGISIRFGAFVGVTLPDGSPGMRGPSGDALPDTRDLVDPQEVDRRLIPDEIKSLLVLNEAEGIDFRPIRAIKQSAGGGIYEVERDGSICIAKQGRGLVGYDDTGRDGATRVRHEASILAQIRHAHIGPRSLGVAEYGDDSILLTELLEGETLHSWKRGSYPLYGEQEEIAAYLGQVLKVVSSLAVAIEKLHELGLAHNDIHTRNIFWDRRTRKLTLIDFESCFSIQDASAYEALPKAVGYLGWDVPNGVPADWYAARQVLQELLFATVTHLDMVRTGRHAGWDVGFEQFKRADPAAWSALKDLFAQLSEAAQVRCPTQHQYCRDQSTVPTSVPHTPAQVAAIERAGYLDSVLPGPVREGAGGLFYGGIRGWRSILGRRADLGSTGDDGEGSICPSLTGRALEGSCGVEVESPEIAIGPGGILGNAKLEQLLAHLMICRDGAPLVAKESSYRSVLALCRAVAAQDLTGDGSAASSNRRVERLRDFRTGLIYGYLAYALPISFVLRSPDMDCSDRQLAVCALKKLLSKELESYVDDGFGGLQARASGRLLPYLSTGSAGFGVVLEGLGAYRDVLDIDDTVRRLLKASSPTACNSIGLFNGYAGLVVGASGLSAYLDRSSDLAMGVSQMSAMGLEGEPSAIPSDGGYRMSTDFASGSLGVDYVRWYVSQQGRHRGALHSFGRWAVGTE